MIAELSDTAVAELPEFLAAELEDTTSGVAEPAPWFVTRDEYYRLHDLGFFDTRRTERIYGSVVIMSPVSFKHTLCRTLTTLLLQKEFGAGFFPRDQDPLPVEDHSEPQPDVAICSGSPRDYTDHPRQPVLLVEISDTTLKRDTGVKARLYAAAGVADYWVLDVVRRRLMVFRQPKEDASSESGFNYFSFVRLNENDVVSPLAKPDVSIKVADMLP
jgi:Uma2 family endonuclease